MAPSQSILAVVVCIGVVALIALIVLLFIYFQRRRAARAYARLAAGGTEALLPHSGAKPRSLLAADSGYVPPDFTPALANEPKQVTLDDFTILRILGRGAFGTVYQIKSKATDAVYAMKEISKSSIARKGEIEHTMAEKEILRKASTHPFVVELYYTFQTAKSLYFVMEFIPGGELYTQLQKARRFPLARARLYAAEIAAALEYLHSIGVIYRDLKPENVLINFDGHIKLLDFGLSKQQLEPTSLTDTLCGTPEYLAPEVLRGEKYGAAVDWWSLGTVLYECLFGLPPFYEAEDKVRMYKRILRGRLAVPPELADQPARDVLASLLAVRPEERLGGRGRGAAEVREHPFFAVLDWDALMARRIPPLYVPRLATRTDSSHFELDGVVGGAAAGAGAGAAGGTQPIDIMASVTEPSAIDQTAFSGFSYTSSAILGAGASAAPGFKLGTLPTEHRFSLETTADDDDLCRSGSSDV